MMWSDWWVSTGTIHVGLTGTIGADVNGSITMNEINMINLSTLPASTGPLSNATCNVNFYSAASAQNGWMSLSVNSNAEYILAAEQGAYYLSQDFGSNFVQSNAAWGAVATAVSKSGQYQVVADSQNIVFYSDTYGSIFTNVPSPGDLANNNKCVAMTNNGVHYLAGLNSGNIYKFDNTGAYVGIVSSFGFGFVGFNSIKTSTDGSVILAGSAGSNVYISNNSGSANSILNPSKITSKSCSDLSDK